MASREDWSSCTSSVKSTSIYGGDSKPITGSYTSRTGRTRVKSWRWRSRLSWSQTWIARRLWPPPSRTQTPPSTQRQRTTVWRCSTSNCSVTDRRFRFPVHTIHAVRPSVKDSRRGNAGLGTNGSTTVLPLGHFLLLKLWTDFDFLFLSTLLSQFQRDSFLICLFPHRTVVFFLFFS